MKNPSVKFGKRHSMYFLLILLLSVCSQINTAFLYGTKYSINFLGIDAFLGRCTVFSFSKGEQVFFGGNDDYIEADSYFWVDPGTQTDYGAIWIGFPDNVQQGVNEKGLAYDANGLPRVNVNSHPERKPVIGGYTSYPIQILRECATVTEVIEWVNAHRWHNYMHDQLHFADASGDAVIISAGADGELIFSRKILGDGYLVSTNFNIANPSNGDFPCWRYQRVQSELAELVNRDDEITFRDVAAVLDAVHVERGTGWTIASFLTDLPNGVVYMYYFHQFDEPIILDVAEEISNPRAPGPLSDLFPEEVQREATRRYQRIQTQSRRSNLIGMGWLGIVIASLVLYLFLSRDSRRGWVFWVPVIIILGPVAFLVWMVACRRIGSAAFQVAIVEAVGNMAPTVIAFLIYLIVAILVPEAGGDIVQIAFIFGFPLVVGWLFFQGLLFSLVSGRGYIRTLFERLPQALVAANLSMAGVIAIASPLFVKSLVFPFSGWTLVYLWALVVFSAIIGMLVLLVFEAWALRHNIRAWYVIATGVGEMVSTTWRQLWWWILLSYAVLFGGIFISQLLQQLFVS